jgi:DNA-binding GntR family transcriptional regulator
MPQLQPLEQLSLRERVVFAIRSAVVRGEFRPGEKIPEGELAEQLGVSRTPVREALRVLEYQGLVVSRPKNGTFIAVPDEGSLRDGLTVRAVLERLALSETMSAGAQSWAGMCDDLQMLLGEMEAAVRSGDDVTATEVDVRWHELLVNASQNTPLSRAWHTCGAPTLVWAAEIKQYPLAPAAWLSVVDEHRRLVSIFRTEDLDASCTAIEGHIMGKLDAMSVSAEDGRPS